MPIRYKYQIKNPESGEAITAKSRKAVGEFFGQPEHWVMNRLKGVDAFTHDKGGIAYHVTRTPHKARQAIKDQSELRKACKRLVDSANLSYVADQISLDPSSLSRFLNRKRALGKDAVSRLRELIKE